MQEEDSITVEKKKKYSTSMDSTFNQQKGEIFTNVLTLFWFTTLKSFPGRSSDCKESPWNAGDTGSIP